MPHCIIEYAKELEQSVKPATMLANVYKATAASGLFDESHIRVRAHAYEHYQTATETKNFIHVMIRLHKGRTTKQRKMLSSLVLENLVEELGAFSAITVEVVEMDSGSYAKFDGTTSSEA